MAEYLQHVLHVLGLPSNVERLLRNCLRHVEEDALLQESVAILGEHLPHELLASITNDALRLASADGLTEEEASFAYSLAEAWQIPVE